jgi:hypothetical protein
MRALYTRSSCPRIGKAAESQPPGGRQRDVLAALRSELLWRDLLVSLLLGVAERPNPREIARRARDAAATFLQLHPLPNDRQPFHNPVR